MDADIYQIYRERREKTPVCWDEQRRLWAVYSYRFCQQVLSHPATLIPPVADGNLGGPALAVKHRLVRISNPPAHDLAREMALRMFRGRRPAHAGPLLSRLLPAPASGGTVEWVSQVGRVLPAMHILAGFGFSDGDIGLILGQLPVILKIMAPVTNAQALEEAFAMVYPIVDRQVATVFPGLTKETQEYAVSNLIGLIIQSHDATKGLLSLALLHLLRREDPGMLASRDMDFFLSYVTEVLRYDSPVHNTRRVLTEDVHIDGATLPAGATVLVVVAAGNRDPTIFERPEEFDRHRPNNLSMLTFGHGTHGCIAGMYCTLLAAETMSYLFHTYRKVEVVESQPAYEPLANVLMVKEMHVRLA
ncbi:MAG TPA: cytochrome P450 [Puia sp.]|uniref:cytochrome P450 n=1 Tax=Puia sp. TaxID=2045100 RepID=UPI002C280D34|nr:cytochrome P450 [Puia sp.]HVU98289.1 cytochrome P450 [Puia sp.]